MTPSTPSHNSPLERAVAHASEQVATTRAEFAGASFGPRRDALFALLEKLARDVFRLRRECALGASSTVDVGAELRRLMDATRGLEAAAAALRAEAGGSRRPPAPATGLLGSRGGGGTQPLAPKLPSGQLARPAAPTPRPPTGGLISRLQRWAGAAEEVPDPTGTQAAAGRAALEAALGFANEILGYVTPRFEPITCALAAVGAAKAGAGVGEALGIAMVEAASTVSAPMRDWVPHLVMLFMQQPIAKRQAQIAVAQYNAAREAYDAGQATSRAVAKLPDAAALTRMEAVSPEKLRGAVTPLSNLHRAFQGIEHLMVLFPTPVDPPAGG